MNSSTYEVRESVRAALPSAEVYSIDPLTDPRWARLLARHPGASVFHTGEWLTAIKQTYGYEPVAFTTSSGDEELANALVFCQVKSWLTGKRLVSLPFSDHCQPLADDQETLIILRSLQSTHHLSGQRYVEVRPVTPLAEQNSGFAPSGRFSFQSIDLRPELKAIYSGFHDSCVRRKIKRAEREELVYESGRSPELLRKFRQLLLLTRRRHKLPPQPAAWFENIVNCLGEMATIHLVSKNGDPVASIVTLQYKDVLVYKYGCSDSRFNSMGGTPLLFWKVIQQAKEANLEHFDLGRSDFEDPGLISFKEHLGAASSELQYYRSPKPAAAFPSKQRANPAKAWAREALVRLPDPLLAGLGQIMYRHIG